MIANECHECNASAGEPCRPYCLGVAALLDTLTDDDRATNAGTEPLPNH